jgi:hypothetical protein
MFFRGSSPFGVFWALTCFAIAEDVPMPHFNGQPPSYLKNMERWNVAS